MGTFGAVFPVEEENLLAHIQGKLQALISSSQLESHQKILTNKTKKYLSFPPKGSAVGHTQVPRVYAYDPTFIVTQDLKDHKGVVFYKKGTLVNPLQHRPLSKPLLFIDGDKKTHVRWVIERLKAYPNAKVILVDGKPFELMKHLDRPVFFDQGGFLIRKLSIQQVPACVRQEEQHLLISEEKADD